MKIRNLLILGLVLMGFTYCSSDEVLDGPTTGKEEVGSVKMQVTVQMPTSATTRSTTGSSDVGSLPGSDNENKANSVLIAIYDAAGVKKGTHSSISPETVGTPGDKVFTTAEFVIPDLSVGSQYYVYAFVNPYDGLSDALDATFTSLDELNLTIDAITKRGDSESETQDNFFMSNAEKVLTETVKTTHITGFPLSVAVNVQRAVARVDYNGGKDFTIIGSTVGVTFTHYKLMNTSKSFYNLKRVNADGLLTTNATICGAENVNNYVVDTDWTVKATDTGWGARFFNYMGSADTLDDTYKELDTSSYVTENTIPSANKGKKGVATAVVFKGKLNVTNTVTPKDPVYVWSNQVYSSLTDLNVAHPNITTDTPTPEELAEQGVTKYTYDNDYEGYPVYYVYYNRHNNNNSATESGPMEFATVRNNIYQLSITSLSRFGHPNDPELKTPVNPDPNPEKPEDDIETSTLYMQVTATVLDWTVRTNAIEF